MGKKAAASLTVDMDRLVVIRRAIRDSQAIEGFIVGLGEHWVLVNVLNSGAFLDGYSAIRRSDIDSIERRPQDSFFSMALRLSGEVPQMVPLDLDSARGLVATIPEHFPLQCVFAEKEHPDECLIGKTVLVGPDSFSQIELDTEARWMEGPADWAYKRVTRLDFGGRYEKALMAVSAERDLQGTM